MPRRRARFALILARTANRVRNAAAPRAVRVKISAITANRVRNAAAPRAVRVNISAISANRVRNAATFSSYSTYFNFVAYFENRFPGSCYRSVLILACWLMSSTGDEVKILTEFNSDSFLNTPELQHFVCRMWQAKSATKNAWFTTCAAICMRMKTQSKWKMCTIYNTLHVHGEAKRPSMVNLLHQGKMSITHKSMHCWKLTLFQNKSKRSTAQCIVETEFCNKDRLGIINSKVRDYAYITII